MTEIVYTWPDGRQEVRYRRVTNSPEALALIEEVLVLQSKHGADCPYSYREISRTPLQGRISQTIAVAGDIHAGDPSVESSAEVRGTPPGVRD